MNAAPVALTASILLPRLLRWIYDGKTEFAKLPGSYKCPVCSSPKNRFKAYKGAVGGKINNTGSALAQRMKKREW